MPKPSRNATRRRRDVEFTRVFAGSLTLSMLLAAPSAWATCTPASSNNVTATCTGATVNQGAGAPGTSAGANGYGAGESGITVNVANGASVTGNANANSNGIAFTSGTINNGVGANISGTRFGLVLDTGIVANAGTIAGSTQSGIAVFTSATIVNSTGGTITGASGIGGGSASISVTNNGIVSGGTSFGILGDSVTVVNNAGASITGPISGIGAVNTATVTNSGTISADAPSTGIGVNANNNVSVTNNAGATITGALYAINSNGSGSVVNAGTISGTFAAINLLGGNSSVFNAGTISVTGGSDAIVFAGTSNTLTLAPGSVISGDVTGTGSDTLQLGGSGAATFDLSRLGSGKQYQGFATFNKVGDSTWTATGASTFNGATNVNAGTLLVNGDLSGSNVTVNAGGILGGTGTVGNLAVNDGTLAPGNSFLVQFNLSFTAASTYLIEVSPSASSFTSTFKGKATLGGASVQAVFAPGSYVSKQYTILSAASGVNGTFGSLTTNLSPNLSASLSYDANDVYLNLLLNFAIPGGLNANQQNVANALTNFFNANGSIPAVYSMLSAAGLTQASGEAATGSQQATFNAMNQFMGVLTDPFIAGRGETTTSSGTSSFAAETGGSSTSRLERDAYAAMFAKASVAQVYDRRWSVWGAGFGGAQTTDGNAALGSNNTTSNLAGIAVGADYRFSPDTVAGFALAGGGTSFSVDNGGYGRSDLFQAGAFVRHKSGPAYVSAALAYGFQNVTTDRIVTIAGVDRLHAEFNANAYSGRIEGGYRFATPWLGGIGLTPYAAAQFTTFDLPAYAEQALAGTPVFALAYAAKTVTDSRSELGVRGDKSFAVSSAILTLRSRLAWAHDFNSDRSVGATFQALPGASFVVNGAARPHDSALTTASAEMRWMNGWSAAASFEGEFAGTVRSYAGKGVVRYSW